MKRRELTREQLDAIERGGEGIPPEWQPRGYSEEGFRQEVPGRGPLVAIRDKASELVRNVREGGTDWGEILEGYIDLWQEARMVVWRAKHSKAGSRQWDQAKNEMVQMYGPDERLVLQAVECVKGVMDSMVKVRLKVGQEGQGIPRWAIERIERALRSHPAALKELLKELAMEGEKVVGAEED